MSEMQESVLRPGEEEEWRVISSIPLYEASNLGRIRRSVQTTGPRCKGGVLKAYLDRTGYLRIGASINNVIYHGLVHWYIAEAFLGPCAMGYCIHHKDRNKTNNHYTNLEYMRECDHYKLCPKGEKSYRAKLTKQDVFNIRWLSRLNLPNKEIISYLKLPISANGLFKYRTGKLWKHI